MSRRGGGPTPAPPAPAAQGQYCPTSDYCKRALLNNYTVGPTNQGYPVQLASGGGFNLKAVPNNGASGTLSVSYSNPSTSTQPSVTIGGQNFTAAANAPSGSWTLPNVASGAQLSIQNGAQGTITITNVSWVPAAGGPSYECYSSRQQAPYDILPLSVAQPSPNARPAKECSRSGGRSALDILLVLLLAGAIGYGIYYYMKHRKPAASKPAAS